MLLIAAMQPQREVPTDLGDLCRYIERTHHAYTRAALAELGPCTNHAALTFGAAIPELSRLQALVTALARDLLPHMMKEERVLFPYLRAVSDRGGSKTITRPPFGTVAIPIKVMGAEHQEVKGIIDAIDGLCTALQSRLEKASQLGISASELERVWFETEGASLLRRVLELVADVREHLRLEDDVVFPKAIAVERQKPPTASATR